MPAIAGAQQTQTPTAAPLKRARRALGPKRSYRSERGTSSEALAPAETRKAATPPPPSPSRGESETYHSPGATASDYGSVRISPTTPGPTVGVPLAHPTIRSETTSRVEELIGAAALVAQGNLSKAMELYYEGLSVAPQYAEAYRQRALTLLRLDDRVQAQVDYGQYLKLDPHARNRVRQEIQLFEQSGYARLGEAEAASYNPISPGEPGNASVAIAAAPKH